MPDESERPVYRLAAWDEQQRVVDFVNAHFDWKLPLINRSEWFRYYYCGERLQFAVAERGGRLLAAVGYIPASRSASPDLWASVWVAERGANGVGLELMAALPGLTGARVLACNNIRANTCVLYRFLGWTAERVPHYYRLAARGCAADYHLCRPAVPQGVSPQAYVPPRLPVGGDLGLARVADAAALAALGLPASPHTPCKDLWYLSRRYFAFPHFSYDVWSVCENGALLAYLVTRTAQSGACGEIPVLRIVDFIGPDEVLPRLGAALDALLARSGAEYADCYCAGVPAAVFAAAGFSERTAGDAAVIPNYLTPPLYENTEYYYFTSAPDGFVLFRADGDQDRPNLPAE